MSARNADGHGDELVTEKTCAACDCKLDESAIKVKIGTHIVEVCCDECARKLGEAIPSNVHSNL